ncbi:MAG: hypothetical protein GF308_02325 [Candidatus Heimdallarchaeota archaeon]|nr:hypothetical protein [Candidatus Heimdallarchaeota archaeon]
MVEIKVNLEQGNGVFYTHAIDFIGCIARADSKSKAIDQLLQDAKEYSAWLLTQEIGKLFRETAEDITKGINNLKIIEEVTDVPRLKETGRPITLFKTDQEPLSEELFEECLTVLNLLNQKLLRTVFPFSEEERKKEIILNSCSINEHIEHLCQKERFFISRFGIEIEQMFLEAINMTVEELDSLPMLEKIVEIRKGTIAVLKAYFPKMKDKVFRSADYTDFPEEPWTFKKVIRLIIEYEREQIKTIENLIKELQKQKQAKEEEGEEKGKKK